MNKQEEIREGLKPILDACDMLMNAPEDMKEFLDIEALKKSRIDQILNYLHSQGVVIQTFRSVEVSPGHVMSGEVTEPLIEVKK